MVVSVVTTSPVLFLTRRITFFTTMIVLVFLRGVPSGFKAGWGEVAEADAEADAGAGEGEGEETADAEADADAEAGEGEAGEVR